MNKMLLTLSLLITSAVGLSGCFLVNNDNNTTTPTVTPQLNDGDLDIDVDDTDVAVPSEIPTDVTDENTVQVSPETKISITSLSYKYEPNVIEAKPGEIIQLTVNNAEGVHDFVIDELNVKSTKLDGAGTDQVTFTIPEDIEVGTTYEFYCSVGKHREMGMVGTLKII